jgi:hypothetical protein
MVQEELEETHAKLEALQKAAAEASKQLEDLTVIVKLLENSDDHTIDPASLKVTEDGYEVSFKDGETIVIPFGKDGKDGRTLIPVGVMQDEDSLYYWQVDGEWLLDDEGNKMRAGATDGADGADGADGVMPQIVVENGSWWIVFEGQEPVEIAKCEDIDGVGVFSDIDVTDPERLILTLLNGTKLEIPYYFAIKVSFSGAAKDTVLIGAGELLPIPYEVLVEGAGSEPVVVTSGTDGVYFSRIVEGEQPGKGMVLVQAPAVFSEGYIFLTAYCGGCSAVKMISFEGREVTPAAETATVRLASGADTVKVAYTANFDYVVSSDTTWLKVVPNPADSTLAFISKPNESDTVRTGTVTVSPKDNPDYVCTTFSVMQATETGNSISYEQELPDGFSFEKIADDRMVLNAPAEGGEAVIWINTSRAVEKKSPDLEWFKTEFVPGDFYNKLTVTVEPNESETSRITEYNQDEGKDDRITISVGSFMIAITVNQAGKAADTTGE